MANNVKTLSNQFLSKGRPAEFVAAIQALLLVIVPSVFILPLIGISVTDVLFSSSLIAPLLADGRDALPAQPSTAGASR